MSAGDLTAHQIDDLKRAVVYAEKASGLKFSTYVGEADGEPRRHALSLLGRLDDPTHSVLVLCDPGARALEIVTGSEASRCLGDHECNLAAVTMRSNFEAGDIAGGLVSGIQQLGDAARRPKVLHLTRV